MHATTDTQTQPKLNAAATIFMRSLYAPRVMGDSARNPITKPGTSLAICEEIARRTPGWRVETEIVERVMIDRPERKRERHTYDLTTHSPTVRSAIARLLIQDWNDTGTTAGGWEYYSNR